MFHVYHSNQLDLLKSLARVIKLDPLDDPFASEMVLVQSPGMAQWLQMELAHTFGIAANIEFPLPASFIWKCLFAYCRTFRSKALLAKPA
ncbi:exodeoxyribonuclease V subunit gamma [Pantoea ananatis]